MAFPVFLDACVLAPMALCDTLLRLAETQTYRPLWSADVLGEVWHTLVVDLGVSTDKADRRIARMQSFFPDAEVTDYQDLIAAMGNHRKDRHVLAAAVRGQAAIIVTANLRDFPRAALTPHGLAATSPDNFLLDQFELYPDVVLDCLREQAHDYCRPSTTLRGLISHLENTGVPQFTAAVRRELRL